MRAALASRDMATVIYAFRHHRAHGGRAIPQSEMAYWLDITQGQLSRLENGRNRIIDLDKLADYARILGIPPSLLWFEADEDETSPNPPGVVRMPDGRRIGLTTPAAEPSLADSLFATLAEYVRTDRIAGPRPLLPVVAEQVRFIQELHQSSRGQARDKIRTVHARFAEFLGWLHQDAGNWQAAIEWSDTAYALARELGDKDLQTYFQVRQSNLAEESGISGRALELAEAALRNTSTSTPRRHALSLVQRARCHARGGHRKACARDLDLAKAHLATVSDDLDTDLAAYFTSGYLAMEVVGCYLQLGEPDRGVLELEECLVHWPAENRRDLGRGLAVLARAKALTGKHDEALDAARNAMKIAAVTGSERIESQVRRAAVELAFSHAPEHAALLRSDVRRCGRHSPDARRWNHIVHVER